MNVRQALFAPSMKVDASKSLGQICSSVIVSCPPYIMFSSYFIILQMLAVSHMQKKKSCHYLTTRTDSIP